VAGIFDWNCCRADCRVTWESCLFVHDYSWAVSLLFDITHIVTASWLSVDWVRDVVYYYTSISCVLNDSLRYNSIGLTYSPKYYVYCLCLHKTWGVYCFFYGDQLTYDQYKIPTSWNVMALAGSQHELYLMQIFWLDIKDCNIMQNMLLSDGNCYDYWCSVRMHMLAHSHETRYVIVLHCTCSLVK